MSRSASKIRTASADVAWARQARPYLAHTLKPKSLHHGSSISHPRFSHDVHVDDKTLVNDTIEQLDQMGNKPDDYEASDSGGGDVDMLFSWDSEQSLLRDLMDEGPCASDEGRLDELIDKLQPSFDEKGKELKQEMAESFVPVMRHITNVHKAQKNRYDVPYAKGLQLFNAGCKNIETATVAEYEEIVDAYELSRAKIADLMEQLKAEYAHRDALWVNFEAKMNEYADSATADIQAAPAQVERTIAKLEKHYQSMDVGKDATALSEKRIKELLSKLP